VSTVTSSSKIPELRRAVRQTADCAYLVEPRVVRRIIRELHGFARLSTRIPHTDVLVAKAFDIRSLAHPDELGLQDFSQLAPLSILVAQPEEHELDQQPLQDLMQLTWSRLFHGMVDLQFSVAVNDGRINRAKVQEAIDNIGQVEFDEAHSVLKSELRLFHPEFHIEAYCEFVAIYLQMHRFQPDLLPVWFPSLTDANHIVSIVARHFDAESLFKATRLYGATSPDLTSGTVKDEDKVSSERRSWSEGVSFRPSARRYVGLLKKRDRWNERGNTVAAGVSAMRAIESATTDDERTSALAAAHVDMESLSQRLRAALNFTAANLDDWQKSLWELLQNSPHGFWNADKKLLYDLQKVCLDHERTIYQVDLVKWVVSRGKRPLRRSLTNVREVMMAKHLASSASRLVSVRLSGAERERLSRLIHVAANLAENQMRERMRSVVHETIMQVGLAPKSIPESVALDKLVEESLDCITERGYLTMGYLRDAISRNDLKLPDLSDPKDLIRGDHLLRSDDRLDVSLDGVYRRGEFYLRWLQVVSSMAFGTRTGRFLTKFLVIPFGGAVVIVEGVQHFVKVLAGPEADVQATRENGEGTAEQSEPGATDDFAGPLNTVSKQAASDLASVEPAFVSEPSPNEPSPNEPSSVTTTDADISAPESANSNNVAIDPEATASPDSIADSAPQNVAVTDAVSPVGGEALEADLPVAALGALGQDGLAVDKTADTVATDSATIPASEYAIPVDEVMAELELPLILLVGFMLMAVIHIDSMRAMFFTLLRYGWRVLRTVVYDIPAALIRLPAIQQFWRARWFVKLRRHITNPLLISWAGCRLVPAVFWLEPQDWWLVGAVSLLLSLVLNSRLGRDTEELTAEWLANAWHDLRSRFLMALLDWVIDFFKWILNVVERFIYAVDEWLRFHSGETWMTVVVKAILGVVWSFVSFLLRIYINLLIEPTLHPVKHFPVVTVAHKVFLPVILIIEHYMRNTLTPYIGLPLAGLVTWFNIVFLPGIFGFLVWELKENWRLYASNRLPTLQPVVIGSHGENGGRLLKPGFHSGTLPKLFRKMRALERKEVSYQRFSNRRALRESLEHTERDIRRFANRDLVRLLKYCSVWNDVDLLCPAVHAASNSVMIELKAESLGHSSLELLFQEQSGWLVASVARHGWLDSITPEMQHSFETALRGFYVKAGIDLVREQMQRNLIGPHPYDVCGTGLAIWPDRQFDREITVDLHRRHQIRPFPPSMAASYGVQPVSREAVVFSETGFRWVDWKRVWAIPEDSESVIPLPLACMQSARTSLLSSGRS